MVHSEAEKTRKLKDLDQKMEQTCLPRGSNAILFVKQAAAYAVRSKDSGCRYAALCDYDHLILLRFDDMPKPPPDRLDRYAAVGRVGESARALIVWDRKDFCKALLGFLIEACQTAGLRYR